MCNWSLVYVKMDAEDQLLLSEDVCNQLHITYHFAVTKTNYDATDQHPPSITVYCIKVKLLQIVRFPPLQSTDMSVQFDSNTAPPQSFITELLECALDDVCILVIHWFRQPQMTQLR